jgi:hypothetical protein
MSLYYEVIGPSQTPRIQKVYFLGIYANTVHIKNVPIKTNFAMFGNTKETKVSKYNVLCKNWRTSLWRIHILMKEYDDAVNFTIESLNNEISKTKWRCKSDVKEMEQRIEYIKKASI